MEKGEDNNKIGRREPITNCGGRIEEEGKRRENRRRGEDPTVRIRKVIIDLYVWALNMFIGTKYVSEMWE